MKRTGTASGERTVALPDSDEFRRGKVAVVGEIRPIVRTAGILPRRGRVNDHARHGDEIREVERVVPGEVERARSPSGTPMSESSPASDSSVWRARASLRSIANDAGIVPHRVVQALANRPQLHGIAAAARQRSLARA